MQILKVQIYLLFLGPLCCIWCYPTLHGRYTRNIDEYHLALPHKLTRHGKFLSFSLPHYFKHEYHNRRKKRNVDDAVNYGIVVGGKYRHLELWPNNKLLSPHAFIEHRNSAVDPEKRKLKLLRGTKVCHYTGKIRGVPNSRVALSTCDGLAGYIMMNGQSYYIEPLEHHMANKKGHHMHLIHKRAISENENFCATPEKWVKDYERRFREHYLPKRNAEVNKEKLYKSKHRYIELLVVCDRMFMEYHKNTDIQNYVLTLINMVYDNYHDASIGNMLDVSLVRIIYLEKEEDEIDVYISVDVVKTLANFCKWQQTVNPKDVKSPIHHDIAVLITRYNFCNYGDTTAGCASVGLANIGTPCESARSCCVSEDNGLPSGTIITHEMGHVMGCNHDNYEISGCNTHSPQGNAYIMSSQGSQNTTGWSTCSKNYVSTLLDSDLGECLNDEPDESIYKFAHLLPGVVYDGNYQCNWFEPGSKLCEIANEEICVGLMCNPANSTACFYTPQYAITGTKCGENKWCMNTRCIEKGKRPAAIHGGWGEWGNWTECSRTCGGGITFRERECNNPMSQYGGRYCIGERKFLKLCNTQKCPRNSTEFRALQCKDFNNKVIMNKTSKWEPFIHPEQPCVLYCINEDRNFAKLLPRVKDGTKCKKGSLDICIWGTCTKIGCDYEVNSDAEEDDCGVCKGRGNTCTVIEDTYDEEELSNGYGFVAEIPKGAVKVVVTEHKPSENIIAISDEDGEFCLNDDGVEFRDGVYDCFNTSFVYNHPEPDKETVVMRGPVLKTLLIYVNFFEKENVGYTYKFGDVTMPNPNYKPKYSWEHLDYTPCSYLCERGTQTIKPTCVEAVMGKMSPELCEGIEEPPPLTRVCNDKPCKTKWRVSEWGSCKPCKGSAGVRFREVECVKESRTEGGDDTIVDEAKCKQMRPPAKMICNKLTARACNKKRSEDDFPEEMMKELFYQSIIDMLDVDQQLKEYFVSQARTIRTLRRHLRQHKRKIRGLEDLCGIFHSNASTTTTATATTPRERLKQNKTESKGSSNRNILTGPSNKTKINVGEIVVDERPSQGGFQIIEVHSGKMVDMNNLSEDDFQKLGNQLDNTIVFDQKKNYTGEKARTCLLNWQNAAKNNTRL